MPDIPYDEETSEHFMAACRQADLAHIRVLSPTSTPESIRQNLAVAHGFVYCTALAGTTGVRAALHPETKKFLTRVRQNTDLPLAVGFGISEPAHVAALIGAAEIAVVGSAVLQEIATHGLGGVHDFVKNLVEPGLVL
ncbi:MAG: hypothetical protein A3J60_00230 [Candidatus Pacebacteria bacterium RIFCSPHIGHO2_02_FULL_46_9]|nr:MAG: hypothetical protein A3J60_00230 [Candidatus Pacebacteria bacterium RIFCSPHIGHO2_02_FULL_46_9]